MNNQIIMNGTIPLYTNGDAIFLRPKATPVQVTEAIRRAKSEVQNRVESDSIDGLIVTQETLRIILEFHLDDVLGHGEEPAFVG
jgi:hypothetical protein